VIEWRVSWEVVGMSRTVQIDWQESAEELYTQYRQAKRVEARKRLHALWLVRQGQEVAQAAQQAGVGRRTLERWLAWYREGGLAGVLGRVPGHGGTGKACWLDSQQQEALLAQAKTGAFRTYEEARQWVQEEYGVAYRYQGLYAVLARLGVHPKVPRPRAAKADPKVQEDWKKGGLRRP
jgi:transposase